MNGVTYDFRCGMYLTVLDGEVLEAHRDLADFIESLESLSDRFRGAMA